MWPLSGRTSRSCAGGFIGKYALLVAMPPYQGGGDMISSVAFERTRYADPLSRFEAGTPPIAGAVGLSAAIEYLNAIGFDRIAACERELLTYATGVLSRVDGLRIIGTAGRKPVSCRS